MEVHIQWDRSHTYTLGPFTKQRAVLLSSGRQDERLTVGGETNISLAMDLVKLCPVFQARSDVVDGEK